MFVIERPPLPCVPVRTPPFWNIPPIGKRPNCNPSSCLPDWLKKTNVLMIADQAGEVSFFKLRDVALMRIPLENIEIALTGNAPITR